MAKKKTKDKNTPLQNVSAPNANEGDSVIDNLIQSLLSQNQDVTPTFDITKEKLRKVRLPPNL